MKILVTGSSGHLGEAICITLAKRGLPYVGIDLKPSKFTTAVGSITDLAFLKKCVKGVEVIIHTATLHKPHIVTHTYQDFVDTNITGTLNLLELAKANGVKSFIFTSTTSAFGDVLTPNEDEPAVWITEETRPIPKNIYGATKVAAEDLCRLFYRNYKLPCLVLKTSRFFPEDDDKKALRTAYDDTNLKANELLFRRVDIEDAVTAHLLAIEKAEAIGFGKYIISATSPFKKENLVDLRLKASEVVKMIFPKYPELYKMKGWEMFPKIDRVYVNEKARIDLGWQPKYDFKHVLSSLEYGKDFRSPLAMLVGVKGYHKTTFKEGPYPVAE